MVNGGITDLIFHTNTASASNGNEYNINSPMSLMNIEITGTGTSTCTFEVQVGSNNWYPFICGNLSTLDTASSTSGKGQIWQMDLTGLTKVRVRISSYTDGTVSAHGWVV